MDMREIVRGLEGMVPEANDTYMGEDGLLHCRKCGDAVQHRIHLAGEDMVVRCICRCVEAEDAAYKERERVEDMERRRDICFGGSSLKGATFAADDGHDPRSMGIMHRYVETFDPRRPGADNGLLLYGGVGGGKTFLAACVANALIDRGYSVLMSTLPEMIRRAGSYREDYVRSLSHYQLLVIDDLGAERSSEYAREQAYTIINARYADGKPLIVTTNRSLKAMREDPEMEYMRIYDRILEMCFPVKVTGFSRRKAGIVADYESAANRLGIG